MDLRRKFFCVLYYRFARWLPKSYSKFGGNISMKIRYYVCKQIFAYCGKNVNIEHGAAFGLGFNIRIGDNSGIGINANIPDGTIIGKNVMMGPNCFVHSVNHRFDRIDIPMCEQGYYPPKSLIIEDDVWIGQDVTIMVGRRISYGSIIAANCVLTKDFPPYSIVGGNPSQLIRSRK